MNIIKAPTRHPSISTSGCKSSSRLTSRPSVRNITICTSQVKPSKKIVSDRFCVS